MERSTANGPDGTPFEDSRYVDRRFARDGKIVQIEVWSDSAERILASRSLEA